jgi:pimeloyl-ACP methyl ester carboxylesterase
MLTPYLQQFGHQVIAMDLPVDDPSATFETYADAVCDEISAVTDDVILVGHSLSGWTIPLVAARRPVKHLVYLCAVVPVSIDSFIEQMAREPDMFSSTMLATLGILADPQCHRWSDVEQARALMFADCDDDSAAAAIAQLRGQAIRPLALPYPLTDLPATPATYVVCGDDRMVNPGWSRKVALTRLRARLVTQPGSHSPFLSRPAQLAAALHELAAVGV